MLKVPAKNLPVSSAGLTVEALEGVELDKTVEGAFKPEGAAVTVVVVDGGGVTICVE